MIVRGGNMISLYPSSRPLYDVATPRSDDATSFPGTLGLDTLFESLENRRGWQHLESPCIKLCVIDPASGHCEGCLRTLAEIVRWASLSDDARRRIMQDLPMRRTRLKAS